MQSLYNGLTEVLGCTIIYLSTPTHPPWGTDKASGGSDGRLCGHMSLLFVIKVMVMTLCESNSYKVIMTALIVVFVVVEISL
jgi:hypothetical protein